LVLFDPYTQVGQKVRSYLKREKTSVLSPLTCQSGPEVDGSSVAFDGLLVETSSLQQNAPATQHRTPFIQRTQQMI
jgi:hypothetical protein